jgi:hypothetical protein
MKIIFNLYYISIFFLLLPLFVFPIFPDQINLKSGKKIKNVKTYIDGNRIKVVSRDNKISFIPKSEIDSIEPGVVVNEKSVKEEIKEEGTEKESLEKRAEVIDENQKLETETTPIDIKSNKLEARQAPPIPFQPYLSLLPFYSASLKREEMTEGYSLIAGKLFFLYLYVGYSPSPKNYVGIRESLLVANTVNRLSNESIRPAEAIIRLNLYETLNQDTLDPFTGAQITKDQYVTRRNGTLGLFLLVTFFDVYLNLEAKKKMENERATFKISTFATQDYVTKNDEIGIKCDFYLF